MPTKLTIVIPFLNEGEEVANTVASIRATTVTDPCITLINDASADGYDYAGVAEKYGCRYVKNAERLGVAESRNKGVRESQTPYFLLLDGHMRLYEQGWDERLVKLLDENPRSVLCAQTRKLSKNAVNNAVVEEHNRKTTFGAFINMMPNGNLGAKWSTVDAAPYSNLCEIPCILGAAYACSKVYWKYLNGLSGLLFYGWDEQLLSIKVWREGGRCLLVKDLEVGHLYRQSFPYEVYGVTSLYNRLFVLELLFPYSIKKDFFAYFKSRSRVNFEESFMLLKNRYADIKAQKDYLNDIFETSIDCFLAMNEKIRVANSAQC
jgi:glycosyltransferase involved in cell wall biosynthesis